MTTDQCFTLDLDQSLAAIEEWTRSQMRRADGHPSGLRTNTPGPIT